MLRYMGKAILTIYVNCVRSLPIFTTSVLDSHNYSLETPYLSCSANVTDSCCTDAFAGLVLSTQFWNTYTGLESQGQVLQKNTWALHGLRTDFCSGSYTQYCDLKHVPLFQTGLQNTNQSFLKADNMTLRRHQIQQPAPLVLLRHPCPTLHRSEHQHLPCSLRQARPPRIHEQILDQPRLSQRRLLGPRAQQTRNVLFFFRHPLLWAYVPKPSRRS